MGKYQFVVGVSLAALEEEVNRLVQDDPSLKLIQVLYAMGNGFVAIIEPAGSGKPRQDPAETPAELGRNKKKSPGK